MATGHHNVHPLPQTNQLRAMHTIIRDRDASRADFVFYSRRIIRLLLESALDLLPFDKQKVTTPVGETFEGLKFTPDLCAVPVIRAGDSMVDELRALVPNIRVGKILIQRDKTTKLPQYLYQNLPDDIAHRQVLLLEPMLATGGSANAAIGLLLDAGVREENIVFVNFLAAPEGIEAVHAKHPAVKIVTSSVEERLNENAFMIPGIGDFGDRFFGTTDSAVVR
ncbi:MULTISPECIES: uracil phosphoribosyltransferase [unclassified Streptomyces]|uniref:uracil phosphoribosyltransferase n=1 Tax=unclassified Streptomyces TaxID=2593676 RepID=UPI002E328171|nr:MULTISPECIES: uracil phosphoribosyltransferase [unclassified Streptomyces]WUC69091.1 uracil phosphoribosyltransferase [Streptomyces sp. NBC_00539]